MSEIFRDGPELLDGGSDALVLLGMRKAMIDMIVDQRFFRTRDGLLDGMKLLRDIDAGSARLNHIDNAAQMAAGPVEPLDDRRMAAVRMIGHFNCYP